MGDQTIAVRVLAGRGLIAVDRGGTSDPYCIVSLGDKTRKTSVQKKTLSPQWTDTPDPFVFMMDARSPSEIEFEVLDWNLVKNHKRMGKVTLPLKELTNGQEYNQWVPLKPTKEGDKVSGEIHISAQYRVIPPRMSQNKSMGVSMFLERNEDLETPLFTAIRNSDIEAVKKLVSDPTTNINEADKYGYYPLHAACCVFSERDDEILTILLRHKDIDVNVMNKDNNTPLHYFCQKFRSPNCSEAFDVFIEKGAKTNAQNNLGETPLHKAILNNNLKILMVNLLIKAKVEINKMNNMGETPLHYVVRCGREDLVSILLKAGAETNIRGTKEKKTPYELAVEQGYDKIAATLIRAQELFEWLEELALEKYYTGFLKEEMYKELLPDLDEKILYRVAPNMPVGNVTKILNAAHALRDEQRSTASKDEPDSAAKPDTQTTHDIEQELEKLKYINKSGTWILHNSELEFAVKLGSGTSGTVYKGLYKSEEVAIKVLKAEQTNKELEEFKKEFQIMSSIQSPYLVFFFGAVLEPKMCMVMELCSRGSLYHVMFDLKNEIGWDKLFSFSKEMLKGVDTLHSWTPQVVHRDLKSLNLMVNELWHVKVADFGLSRFNTDTQKDTLGKMRGTYAYCAPEIYNGEQYTDKADVYSTAIILWEMIVRVITREYMRPYQEYPNLHFDFQIIIQTAKKHVRPTIPEKCPEALANVVKNAWSPDIAARPSAKQLLEQIEEIEKEYLSNVEHWNSLIAPPKEASE